MQNLNDEFALEIWDRRNKEENIEERPWKENSKKKRMKMI